MSRYVSLVFAAALAAAAAAVPVRPARASGFPVTVRSCDRQVTLDKAPQRAVSQDINLTEMMLALGLKDRMAGYSGISGWYKLDDTLRAALAGLPEVAPQQPTKEALLGVEADFLFAGWNYGMKVGGEVTPQTLAPLGIAVYELTESCIHIMKKDKASLEDMYADIGNLGLIFGVAEKAEALISGYRGAIEAARAAVPKDQPPLKVFVYDSGERKPFTAGRFGMPTALIEAAGGENIMADVATSWTEIGWEPVIERNPEVIVIVDYGEVTAAQKADFMRANPAFARIPAVANNRFVVLPYAEATPGPRNIEAVRALIRGFYPAAGQ